MPPLAGGDTRKGSRSTQGKGKEHCKTSNNLLQMNPGEIVSSRVLYLDATARLPEVGENSSAVQFNTVRVDTNSVFHPEEYEAEVDSMQSST